MIAETSKEAFAKIQDKLGHNQMIVYKVIERLGAPTNEQIAEDLGWPINQVTGRVTELRKRGFVGNEGRGINKSGFTANKWSTRDPNDKNLLDMANDCGA